VRPRVILGSIHSHPNTPWIGLSKEDLAAAEYYGEVVFGVLTWWKPSDRKKRETELDFYCEGKPIKYEVL